MEYPKLKIKVLGSGTSTGIPEYLCTCETCQDARTPGSLNARSRPSIHIDTGSLRLQVDTGPNFLDQIDRFGVDRIDAVLYTHCHADHISGTNDLVMPCRKQQMDMPIYGPEETMAVLRRNFDYMFTRNGFQGGGVAHLLPNPVSGPFEIDGVELIPVPVEHGSVDTVGYRLADFAYLSDVKRIPGASMELLSDVKVLILDALSFNPRHPTHLSVAEAIEIGSDLGVERLFLTHIMHRLDHRYFADQCRDAELDLPDFVALAYDGMVIEVGG